MDDLPCRGRCFVLSDELDRDVVSHQRQKRVPRRLVHACFGWWANETITPKVDSSDVISFDVNDLTNDLQRFTPS
eukprot:scaffold2192_cov170-Amphora_coffeaeformis.AAC.16